MESSASSSSARAALNRLGLSARKALGQHFLMSRSVVSTILRAAALEPSDTVVEIGPGLGVVTQELVRRAGRVIAVEVDEALAAALERRLATERLTMLRADARQLDVAAVTEGQPYKLVANLPYYAANPILRRFLESANPPELAVVMLQREVAENVVAQPGDMSLVSVGVQLYGKPAIVGYVPPSAFYPPPKVTSAIVRIDIYPEPALDLDDIEAFFQVVRAGFTSPRKQLRNGLSQGLKVPPPEATALLEGAGIDPQRRAATLSLEEWGALYRQVQRKRVDANAVRGELVEPQTDDNTEE